MPPDRDLDRELRDLGPRIEYPPVPDLAGSVRGRLETEAGGPEAAPRPRPQLWWIAAAALVLLVAVPVLSLALRDMGGGGMAGGVAAGGDAAESGGREAADGDPTRLVEEEGPMPAGEEEAQEDGTQEARPSMSDESEAPSASAGSAQAACASVQPVLQAHPSRGSPGDEFEIRGSHFIAGSGACDDTPSGIPSRKRKVPNSYVSVEFRQDGRTWKLGSVKADGKARISATMKVPSGARPGRAVLHASYEQGSKESSYSYSAGTWFLVLDQ